MRFYGLSRAGVVHEMFNMAARHPSTRCKSSGFDFWRYGLQASSLVGVKRPYRPPTRPCKVCFP